MKLVKKVKLHYKLPRHFNNGDPVSAEKLVEIKNFFIDSYGGLTVDSPSQGYWEEKGFVFHDVNVEYSIFIPKSKFERIVRRQIPSHITKFKKDFKQIAIFCYYHDVMST